jgi:hypothetical protein
VSALWPLSPQAVGNIEDILRQAKELDERTGGWKSKSQLRQTGLSLYLTFENKVDLMATTIPFLNLLENAPGLLVNACERLLEAHRATSAE